MWVTWVTRFEFVVFLSFAVSSLVYLRYHGVSEMKGFSEWRETWVIIVIFVALLFLCILGECVGKVERFVIVFFLDATVLLLLAHIQGITAGRGPKRVIRSCRGVLFLACLPALAECLVKLF